MLNYFRFLEAYIMKKKITQRKKEKPNQSQYKKDSVGKRENRISLQYTIVLKSG